MSTLKVLTYNTHLFKGSLAAWALYNVVADEERQARIVEKIKESGADVVCLQEVWADHRMDELQKLLSKSGFPHTTRGSKGTAGMVSSGLVVASRYPITYSKFKNFGKGRMEGDDKRSHKGVLVFRVDVPISETESVPVRFGVTHAPTNPTIAVDAIKDFVPFVFDADDRVDTIFLGDFNIHRGRGKYHGGKNAPEEGKSEYEALKDVMAGAEDVLADEDIRMDDLETSYTDWPQGTAFKWVLNKQEDLHSVAWAKKYGAPTGGKDRIDYVFFKGAAAGSHLKPISDGTAVPHDWALSAKDADLHYPFHDFYSQGKDRLTVFGNDFARLELSDHSPVIVNFAVH